MAILITGAAGFVGLAVGAHLLETGASLVLFDNRAPPDELLRLMPRGRYRVCIGDIRDQAAIERACDQGPIDAVIHLAAITAGPARETAAPEEIASVNVGGTIALMKSLARRKPRRVLHLSSVAIYGFADPGPTGRYAAAQSCPRPESLYGITKLAGEQTALRLGALFGLDVRVVRLGAVFGPWEYESGVRDAMSPHLQVLKAAEAGQTSILSRAMRNDWIYVRDAAEGIARVLGAEGLGMEEPGAERIFDLGGDTTTDLPQWGEALRPYCPGVSCRVAMPGETATVLYNMPRDRAPLDITAIERATGFRPRFDLAAAAQYYVAWLERRAARDRSPEQQA
jgi:nucleoside-diphosphate-sugar epimerase